MLMARAAVYPSYPADCYRIVLTKFMYVMMGQLFASASCVWWRRRSSCPMVCGCVCGWWAHVCACGISMALCGRMVEYRLATRRERASFSLSLTLSWWKTVIIRVNINTGPCVTSMLTSTRSRWRCICSIASHSCSFTQSRRKWFLQMGFTCHDYVKVPERRKRRLNLK